jgi:hypothetical protein
VLHVPSNLIEVIRMWAHGLLLLPAAGFLLAAATGIVIRSRRERSDERVRNQFKI